MFLIIIASILLFSCTNHAPTTEVEDIGESQDSIIFFNYASGSLEDPMTFLIDRYVDSFGSTPVKSISYDHEAFKEVISLMLANNAAPDCFSWWAGSRVSKFAKHGLLHPLDTLFSNDSISQLFRAQTIEHLYYDDKLYMIPVALAPVGFFYNRSLFQKYGLLEPQTWEDFSILCERLIDEGVVPISLGARYGWPVQFWLDYLLLTFEGVDAHRKFLSGELTYDSREIKSVLKKILKMVDDGWIGREAFFMSWDDSAIQVERGGAAMTLMGSYIRTLFKHRDVCESSYGFFPFPKKEADASLYSLGSIDGIVVPSGRYSDAVADFVLYWSDSQTQSYLADLTGVLPALNHSGEFSEIDSLISLMVEESGYFALNYDLMVSEKDASFSFNILRSIVSEPHRWTDSFDKTLKSFGVK